MIGLLLKIVKENYTKLHASLPILNKRDVMFHEDLALRLKPSLSKNHNTFILNPWPNYANLSASQISNHLFKCLFQAHISYLKKTRMQSMFTRSPLVIKDKNWLPTSWLQGSHFHTQSTYLSLSYIRCVSLKQTLFLNAHQCMMLLYERHATNQKIFSTLQSMSI